MNAKIESAFVKLEQQRNYILKRVSEMSIEKYQFGSQDKWAVSQVIAHLITSERLSLMYMKKKAQGIDQAGDSGFAETLKTLVLKLSQRLPVKYKAPKFIVANTPEALTLEKATIHWQQVRQELKVFAEAISEKNIHKKIFKHPVAGMLDIIQAMDFLYEHIRHHWPQIKSRL